MSDPVASLVILYARNVEAAEPSLCSVIRHFIVDVSPARVYTTRRSSRPASYLSPSRLAP